MNQPLANVHQGQAVAPRSLAQIVANLGPQSQLASQSTVDPKGLAAGIKPSFATLTFKGKTWGIRFRGVNHQLLARDPNTGAILGSIPTVDVVLLKSATAISKAYYIEKYKEGDFKQPDCWSTNGQVPDPAAPKKQNPTCRGCKWDAFGSRAMDDGRQGKACSDNKRLAVVPAADLKNETYGGSMLLKLPPSGFAGLSELEAQLLQAGYNYFAVVMRLSFDYTVAFPKIVFTPIAVLNDHQMQEVINLQHDAQVDRILSEELFEVAGDPDQPTAEAQQDAQQPTQPTQPATPAHQPQPQQAQAFAPVAPATQHQQPASPPDLPPPGPVPGVASVQGFTATPMTVATPAPTKPVVDDLAIPPALDRRLQRDASQVVTNGASVQQGGEQVTETPEQKIARLEAALAQAQGVAAKPARKTTKRTQPVTPAGNQPSITVQPSGQIQAPQGAVPLPLPTTAPTQANGGGGEVIVPNGADDDEDMPSDLASRVDALLNPTQ